MSHDPVLFLGARDPVLFLGARCFPLHHAEPEMEENVKQTHSVPESLVAALPIPWV